MRAFFFAPESVRPLARVRFALLAVLLFEAACHWPYAVELYSTAGPVLPMFLRTEIIPNAPRTPEGRLPRRRVGTFHPPVPWPATAILLATGRLFVLTAAMLGWRTRTSLLLSFVLCLTLGLLDGINFAKYSVIALHCLALLACSGCGREWSVDAWLEKSSGCALNPAWPRRLIQILLCHVYLGAILTKCRTPGYFTGELLEFALLDDVSGGGWLGKWVATQQTLVVILSLSVALFEVLFPFLIWFRRTRPSMLGLAVLVHLGMSLLLNVGIFSPVMLAALLVFVDEPDWTWLRRRLFKPSTEPAVEPHAPLHRGPGSFGAYLAAMVLTLAVDLGVQWYRDDYGVFERRTLPMLDRLESADVDERLWPVTPTPEHFIHHVAIGSRVNGNLTFGERRRFRVGDKVLVTVRWLHGHPAMPLEGLLISTRGQEVARFTTRVDANVPISTNGFELVPPLTPGTYAVILQADGFEVARREIDILP